MNKLSYIFGQGEDLDAWQMSARAIVVFIITLVLIRIGGVRIFGKKSAFDIIIMIVMGSVLARGIVGASRLEATIAASTSMIIIHRLLSWLCIKNHRFEMLVKGRPRMVFKDQHILEDNLVKESLSKEDFLQSVRLETQNLDTGNVDSAFMETNGRISFIKKEKKRED